MIKIRGLKILLNRVRLAWFWITSKAQSLFSRSNKSDVPPATSVNDNTESQVKETQVSNLENERDNVVSKLDQEDVFYDTEEDEWRDVFTELGIIKSDEVKQNNAEVKDEVKHSNDEVEHELRDVFTGLGIIKSDKVEHNNDEVEDERQGVLAGQGMLQSAWSLVKSKAQNLFPLSNEGELHQYEEVDVLPGREMLQSAWSWITSKAQSLFSSSNEEETQNIVVESVENIDNSVGKVKENMHTQASYADNKLYSTKNNSQEVDKITYPSQTFAIVLYDHTITKYPDAGVSLESGMLNELTDFQLMNDDTKEDRSKAGKCALKFGQLGVEFGHIRLAMSLLLERNNKESLHELLQYTDKEDKSTGKEGKKHIPSMVILIDKPDNINLEPTNLGKMASFVWSHIKASEAKKSTRITQTLFPTFEIGLSEEQGKQNLKFVLKQAAIPDIIEDLKKEKPTLQKILNIAFLQNFIISYINIILDAVMVAPQGTNEKVADFHIRDVLMNGAVLNKLRERTNGQEANSSDFNGQQTEKPNLQRARIEHVQAEQVMKEKFVT